MRYAINSSTFKAFGETRDKFWKRLRFRGYPVGFLLPLFREVTELSVSLVNANPAAVTL